MAGSEITTTTDFVVLEKIMIPMTKWDGTDTRFAYHNAPDLKYYPADGTYDQADGSFSGGTSASR